MSDLKPLTLHMIGTGPNPWKVIIILEELGLPWVPETVEKSDLKIEPFISLNPNGKVPVLADSNTGIVLWESGAIIDYLIEEYDKENKLRYASFPEKYTTRCWEHFQMSGQGPFFGQKGWFSNLHPEKIPSAIERYSKEVMRITGVIDAHLGKQNTDYLVGDKITYADLMFVPFYKLVPGFVGPEMDLTGFKNYTAWFSRMLARPIVSKVMTAWEQEAAASKRAHHVSGNK